MEESFSWPEVFHGLSEMPTNFQIEPWKDLYFEHLQKTPPPVPKTERKKITPQNAPRTRGAHTQETEARPGPPAF